LFFLPIAAVLLGPVSSRDRVMIAYRSEPPAIHPSGEFPDVDSVLLAPAAQRRDAITQLA
jgi:hypothetical protein